MARKAKVSRMAEVAKMLGVELEEPFRIDGEDGYFRLTDTGLGTKRNLESEDWYLARANMLNRLLIGGNEVIKLPWKPQEGEQYYMPFVAINPGNMYDEYCWENEDIDIKRYRMGLVCKTSEEAVAMTMKMLTVAKEAKENG